MFEDRQQAGAELAGALERCKGGNSLVLAIPRGGVIVGFEVAKTLGLDLDVIVPRKVRAPFQEELAIGAVVSWGDHERILDEHSITLLGVSEEYIDREVREQLAEINRRLVTYRGTTQPPEVAGRTVILVDDGIATGYTTRAAALATRKLGAEKTILAVPVGPPDSVSALRPFVDDLICLRMPSPFMAVGYWYRNFDQVSDMEVITLLREARLWHNTDNG